MHPSVFFPGWIALAAMVVGCSQDQARETPSSSTGGVTVVTATRASLPELEINPRLLRRFQPLPATLGTMPGADSEAKTSLGRQLFYEPRLSKSGDIACSTCHDLTRYGVDGTTTSLGFNAQHGTRNAPTVYNAAGSFTQFWDGRAGDVEEQAKEPILNPLEMAMPSGASVVESLRAIPGYAEEFRAAFPGEPTPLTFDNVGRAIGAFERKLVTPGRWDDFLRGDKAALSVAEKEGLRTFLNVGCMVCHTGPFVGGSMYERVGVVEPWPNQKDRGRGELTKLEGDNMMFKVPTLRNIAKTAPYFHDGSAPTLDVAIRMMGRHQLGLDLTPAEVSSIATWLQALTGDVPRAYVARPALPGMAKLSDAVPAPAAALSATDPTAPTSATTCGTASLPDCPLQGWMKGNAAPAIARRDAASLKKVFQRIATFAPAGYPAWTEIARRGEAAAGRGDLEECRRACKQCHDDNKSKYLRERRAEPIH